MTLQTLTRTVTYTVRSHDTNGTPETSDDTYSDRVMTRIETYVVDVPDAPATTVLNPLDPLPAGATLTSSTDFIDTDRDGQIDAGETVMPSPVTGTVAVGTVVVRTREEALADARNDFIGGTWSPGSIGGSVTDYVIAEDMGDADTLIVLAQNAELEALALARLSSEDQARYQALRTALASDARAQLALQTMLIDGRLPGEPAMGTTNDGKNDLGPMTLLEQLEYLSTAPTATGLFGASSLLSTVVKEVAFPEMINQGNRGTCTVSATLIGLAMENPAEYVRLVTGLASPTGTVLMANGDLLEREPDTVGDDGVQRTISQRLLAPALMEYGDTGSDYDNSDPQAGGLWHDAHARVAQALFNRTFDHNQSITTWFGVGYSNANKAIEAFQAGEWPVLMIVEFPDWDSTHVVLVTGVEVVNGETFVTYANPWGQVERVSYEELSSKILGTIQPQ